MPRSASRARGRIDYALVDTGDGGTRVEVEIGYALTGTLAQFSRGAIATDLVRRLTSTFATNLEAAIAGDAVARREGREPQPLDAAGLLGVRRSGAHQGLAAHALRPPGLMQDCHVTALLREPRFPRTLPDEFCSNSMSNLMQSPR